MISYKEVQALAGYTTLVYELHEVLSDLEKCKFYFTLENKFFSLAKYVRIQVNQQQHIKIAQQESLIEMNKGEIFESENIKFEDVPIYTPNRDLLIEKLNIEVENKTLS